MRAQRGAFTHDNGVIEGTEMLEFRILGEFEVLRDNVAVELAGQRALTALVVLLLEANHVVSSDRLADALWGDEPPQTAATALRNTISQLRKALGTDAIETRPPGYALRVNPEQLDLARVEGRIAAARDGSPSERVRLLREALGEFRGRPLEALPDGIRLESESRRLEELRLRLEEDLIEAELEAGGDADLVPRIEALVADHPERERSRGQLMLALYRGGRQAEALQAYHDARRFLSAEFGLEPGPALRRLHGSILRQEAGLEAATPSSDLGPAAEHLQAVAETLLGGRLVPVLAPTVDLAPTLAARFGYPPGDVIETPRVSQFVAALRGHGPLHDELRAAAEHGEPNSVHRFFASLPPLLRERGLPHQLLVTADYDGALEHAFAEAGEEVDVVSYLAAGPNRGRFCHISPDRGTVVIETPGDYATELSLERRTVVIRVRGRADSSPAREWESFVVTEDDHLDYLRRADIAGGLPVALAATLRRSHFLFLGYGVRDWCLRLVLSRICSETPLAYRSWAVSPQPHPSEAELWHGMGVDLLRAPLESYVDALARTVGAGEEALR
jgi:DNA-binding SARP family transcriptional activator